MFNLIEKYIQKYSIILENFSEDKNLNKNENILEDFQKSVPKQAFAFFISAYFKYLNKSLCIICPNNAYAEQYSLEAELFIDKKDILYFPGYENLPYSEGGVLYEHIIERVRSLYQINNSSAPLLVFTSVDAVIRKLPEKNRLEKHSIELKIESHYPINDFLLDLIKLGYKRTNIVEAPGEFCVKGSLIDLYPINLDNAVRIDYYDELIENIRYFDIETQKSFTKSTEKLKILSTSEIVLDEDEAKLLINIIFENSKDKALIPNWAKVATATLTQLHSQGLEFYYNLVIKTTSFFDYFKNEPLIINYPALEVKESFSRIYREFQNIYEQKNSEEFCVIPSKILLDNNFFDKQNNISIYQTFNNHLGFDDTSILKSEEENAGLKISSIRQKIYDKIDEGATIILTSHQENQLRRITSFLQSSIKNTSNPQTNKNSEKLDKLDKLEKIEKSEKLDKLEKQDKTKKINKSNFVNIVKTKSEAKKIILENIELESYSNLEKSNKVYQPKTITNISEIKTSSNSKKVFYLQKANLHEGFSIPELSFYIITDNELFGKSYQRKLKAKRLGSIPIETFLDLKIGSYIVHLIHGIGKFLGLQKVRALGRDRDFLILEYADNDKLFVPLDQISMVQQYVAPTEKPKLDSLGKASFKKVKEKVEEKVKLLAKDLLRVQALRASRKGFKFPPDTAWQQEFESQFPFTETPDQLKAIEAVKLDMEKEQAMDRLICADVGYGKTEIAIRAAFKAVLSGKQVAFIAPTTILAWQHFQNLKKRYDNYPISVDWVSRFRTSKEVRIIKEKLLEGELDLIVGTHALLSESVKFKNLGLLVIDEEQRFGVSHKEAIKKLRSLVDVLTLSATPIPRTLHMSLVGIKELSIMETPPRERLPIKTYVQEERDSIIEEALLKEKSRGGQSFFLHNRISTIETTALRIQKLIPELSIAVLHGQMQDDEIEDVLMRFQEGVFDLLVTTTIIENGIDIPNVNTLIVDRADHFGLSQLYQIRGRVGRSDKQAYAYFLYDAGRTLNEDAQKRLSTILEYQELGSGFKISMRDLEIRGAGNVLGSEQSGHIVDVGYELYLKLLNDAIQELRGEKIETVESCVVQLETDFYIPESYIKDVRQRIEFYKRFEGARYLKNIEELCKEMEDRFGPPDETTKIFIQIEKIRALSQNLGFISVIKGSANKIEFKVGEYVKIKPQKLIHLLQTNKQLSIRQGSPNMLYFNFKTNNNFIQEVIEILEIITKTI